MKKSYSKSKSWTRIILIQRNSNESTRSKKQNYVIIALFFVFSSVYGQLPSNLKVGSYKSFDDLLNNIPQYECNFQISQRSEVDIKMVAGNDFSVISDSGQIKKSVINSNTFAVFDGENLYLNGKHINGRKHYCLVENNQRYLILKAGIPTSSKSWELGYDDRMIQTISGISVVAGGAIGGAISGAQLAMVRFYYIVDSKTGNVKILSKDYLTSLLKNYPDLKSHFESEKDTENQVVLLKYIKKINGETNTLIIQQIEN